MELWKEQWLKNYNGETEAHKDLEKRMKKNYKGHKYIPWATMVKWLYLQDPHAKLDILETAGKDWEMPKIVHSSEGVLHTEKGDTRTRIPYVAHSVKVYCKFLGKEFVEVYPVQDNAYNAPNYYDTNMVNKAIQRAKAKIISTATGLAYSLYEDGDLQFEDDAELVKKEFKKKVEKPQEEEMNGNEKVTPVKATPVVEVTDSVKEVVDFINNTKDIEQALQHFNTSVVKTYGFSLVPNDPELTEKVSKLSNPKIFGNALKKKYEDVKNAK